MFCKVLKKKRNDQTFLHKKHYIGKKKTIHTSFAHHFSTIMTFNIEMAFGTHSKGLLTHFVAIKEKTFHFYLVIDNIFVLLQTNYLK